MNTPNKGQQLTGRVPRPHGLLAFCFCLLSSLLVWASFPPLNFHWLVWISLVPLFWAIHWFCGPFWIAGLTGYVWGFILFLAALWWIGYVTVIGMLFLVAYLAIFGFVLVWALRHSAGWSIFRRMIFISSGVVLLEWLRGVLFTGFGWIFLAHTQAMVPVIIQISDITGTGGISFLIVAVNVLVAELLDRLMTRRGFDASFRWTLGAVVFLTLLTFVYGYWKLSENTHQPILRTALVQGNTRLADAWSEAAKPHEVEKHLALSQKTLAASPDLIVWPESAFPAFYWERPDLMAPILGFIKENNVPLMIGSVTSDEERYFNSARLLVPPEGEEAARYSKMHLVVFGEFIPFRREFPFLANVAPIDDFTPGEKITLFEIAARDGRKIPVSVLICFEDTVPELARRQTLSGSRLLINMTNDAWFHDSPGLQMHLHNALFRAVENRRALVRATNTGVSCLVDARGLVGAYVQSEDGKTLLVEGAVVAEAPLCQGLTWHTKFPWAFTLLCFIAILLISLKVEGGRSRVEG